MSEPKHSVHKLPPDHRLVELAERLWQPWLTIDVYVCTGISTYVQFKCIDGDLLLCPSTVERAEAALLAMLGEEGGANA